MKHPKLQKVLPLVIATLAQPFFITNLCLKGQQQQQSMNFIMIPGANMEPSPTYYYPNNYPSNPGQPNAAYMNAPVQYPQYYNAAPGVDPRYPQYGQPQPGAYPYGYPVNPTVPANYNPQPSYPYGTNPQPAAPVNTAPINTSPQAVATAITGTTNTVPGIFNYPPNSNPYIDPSNGSIDQTEINADLDELSGLYNSWKTGFQPSSALNLSQQAKRVATAEKAKAVLAKAPADWLATNAPNLLEMVTTVLVEWPINIFGNDAFYSLLDSIRTILSENKSSIYTQLPSKITNAMNILSKPYEVHQIDPITGVYKPPIPTYLELIAIESVLFWADIALSKAKLTQSSALSTLNKNMSSPQQAFLKSLVYITTRPQIALLKAKLDALHSNAQANQLTKTYKDSSFGTRNANIIQKTLEVLSSAITNKTASLMTIKLVEYILKEFKNSPNLWPLEQAQYLFQTLIYKDMDKAVDTGGMGIDRGSNSAPLRAQYQTTINLALELDALVPDLLTEEQANGLRKNLLTLKKAGTPSTTSPRPATATTTSPLSARPSMTIGTPSNSQPGTPTSSGTLFNAGSIFK